MARLIESFDNQNKAIYDFREDPSVLKRTYFNLVRLDAGETAEFKLEGIESVAVLMSGLCDITVDGENFGTVGGRKDVWSGKADSVYCPPGSLISLTGGEGGCEVALAGGACDEKFAAFRVSPEEVDMVDVGSPDTHSRRRIFHILGQNAVGRAGNLLVSELYCDDGCWSGYPPHKHDEEREGETAHEELYHYRFNPENGFGGQYHYEDRTKPRVYMTQNRDTFVFSSGYHPTVTSPGHDEYIFTILVGEKQRSLVQHFHEDHQELMDAIPGIGAMRDKFK